MNSRRKGRSNDHIQRFFRLGSEKFSYPHVPQGFSKVIHNILCFEIPNRLGIVISSIPSPMERIEKWRKDQAANRHPSSRVRKFRTPVSIRKPAVPVVQRWCAGNPRRRLRKRERNGARWLTRTPIIRCRPGRGESSGYGQPPRLFLKCPR